MNKKEIVAKIKGLDSLDNTEKAYLVNLVNTTKKYGLVWEDKIEDVEEELRTKLPIFKEVKERAILNDTETEKHPNHILIEGDNLHALTALTFTHQNKVDLIYIDPPYNTGNKDFIYNDHYIDREDSYRHSKWLSFMNKRLKIAKDLLNDKGVIFISIDDNEFAQLKILCDEIFGENNFIAKFDWRKKTGANDAKDIAVVTETIFLYAKNHTTTIEENIWLKDKGSINQKRYKLSDEFIETRGLYYLDTLDRGGLQYSDSMNFGIQAPDGGIIFPNGRSEFTNDGWIWKWGKDKVKWGIENNFLEFVKSNKSKSSKYTIKYKVYKKVDNKGIARESLGRAFSNLITEPINQQGKADLTKVFDGKVLFSNPKPIGLLQYLIQTVNSKNYTIIDFFAGSGTTLHSLIELNSADGGARQGILVTNNENNIAEEVTYERNKRVINGYTDSKEKIVKGLKNNNLRYYKCDYAERKPSLKNKKELTLLATELLCIRENCYNEITSTLLKAKWHKFFTNGSNNYVYVIYDDFYIEEAIEALTTFIENNGKDLVLKVYVFSNGQYAYAEEFENIAANITLAALPDAIYKAYQNVLPKEEREDIPTLEDEINDETAN